MKVDDGLIRMMRIYSFKTEDQRMYRETTEISCCDQFKKSQVDVSKYQLSKVYLF